MLLTPPLITNSQTGKPIRVVTLHRHFRSELDRGAARANTKVVGALFEMGGDHEDGISESCYGWRDCGYEQSMTLPLRFAGILALLLLVGLIVSLCTDARDQPTAAEPVTYEPTVWGEPVRGVGEGIRHMSFRHDSAQLVSIGTRGVVQIWSMETGAVVRQWPAHEGSGICAFFYDEGRKIVTAGRDSVLRFWDAGTGDPVGESVALPDVFARNAGVQPRIAAGCEQLFLLMPEEQKKVGGFFVGWFATSILRVDLEKQELLAEARIPGGRITSYDVASDGRFLLVLQDYALYRWDLESNSVSCSKHWVGGGDPVSAIRLFDQNTQCFLKDAGGLMVYDSSTFGTLRRHGTGYVTSLAGLKQDGSVAFIAQPMSVRAVDLTNDETLFSSSQLTGALVLSPDEKTLAVLNHGLRFFDAETGAGTLTTRGHQQAVTTVTCSQDGSRLLTSATCECLMWNEGEIIYRNALTSQRFMCGCAGLGFMVGGEAVIASGPELLILDTNGQTLRTITIAEDSDWTASMRVFPDGEHAVTTHPSGRVKVWDLRHGKAIAAWQDQVSNGVRLGFTRLPAISEDAMHIAYSITHNNKLESKILVRKLGEADPTLTIKVTDACTNCVEFRGRQLVTGDSAGRITCYEIEHGTKLGQRKVTEGVVTAFSCSADKRSIFAVVRTGLESRVLAVDASDLSVRFRSDPLPSRLFPAISIVDHPATGGFVTAMDNGTVMVWEPQPATR